MAVGIELDDKLDYWQFQEIVKSFADKNGFSLSEILNVPKENSRFGMDIYLRKRGCDLITMKNIPFNERFRVFQIYYDHGDGSYEYVSGLEKQVYILKDIFNRKYGIMREAWFDERKPRERRGGLRSN